MIATCGLFGLCKMDFLLARIFWYAMLQLSCVILCIKNIMYKTMLDFLIYAMLQLSWIFYSRKNIMQYGFSTCGLCMVDLIKTKLCDSWRLSLHWCFCLLQCLEQQSCVVAD